MADDRFGEATGEATGRICAGCGEPVLHGQSVIRLEAGLLMAPEHFDPVVLRPDVYLHAGGGYDTRFDVMDRWCATPEGFEKALTLIAVHGGTSASGH
jgi:hypothetical protein